MLTEEQLAATIDAIETTSVDRLILVGDPRQLPPIGAGRPFVDIVQHVKAAATNQVSGIALDSSGRVYLAGNTDSSDLPVSPDALKSTIG